MEQANNDAKTTLKRAIIIIWLVIFLVGVVVSYYNDINDPIMFMGIKLHNAMMIVVPLSICITVFVLHKIKSNRKGNM